MSTQTNINEILSIMNWSQNKNYNPFTNKKIKINGPSYNKLNSIYIKYFPNNYSFIDSVEDKDPISFEIFWINDKNIKKMIYTNLSNLIIYKYNNLVHCFEKTSLEYMKSYNILNHPITMDPIPLEIINNINIISIKQNIDTRIKNIFNKLTNISIFIDYNDFINLSENLINILYYELSDLYKKNINHNSPFKKSTIEFNNMLYNDKNIYIIDCMEKITITDIYINYYIIVAGLGMVIPKVKKMYPNIIFI